MEYYWNLFNNSGSRGDGVGGHDSNSCGNHAWESWDLAGNNFHAPSTSDGLQVEAGGFHTLMLRQDQEENAELHFRSVSSSLYSGKGPCHHNPDPHLTFMKLGKRKYLPRSSAGPSYTGKKGKFCDPSWEKTSGTAVAVPAAVPAVVPSCQVQSCGAVLANVYHRRHKVCEKLAKASKVLVLGIEQRFCQQCSRFHAVNEFDESKRSCRRRLAGHNERRRKSSQVHSLAKRSVQEMKMMAASRNPHHFSNSSECALSLLSSTNQDPCTWNSISASSDLPTRRSAALRELIAENRASILACSKNNPNFNNDQMENFWIQNGSNLRFLNNSSQQTGGQLTLDLMQASSSEFVMFSMHDYDEGNNTKLFKAVNYQQECSDQF